MHGQENLKHFDKLSYKEKLKYLFKLENLIPKDTEGHERLRLTDICQSYNF